MLFQANSGEVNIASYMINVALISKCFPDNIQSGQYPFVIMAENFGNTLYIRRHAISHIFKDELNALMNRQGFSLKKNNSYYRVRHA